MTNLLVTKKLLAIFAFCFLIFAFSSTPTRACSPACSADAPHEITPCGVVCGDVLFLYGNNYRLCATDPVFPAPAPGSRNGSWHYDKATFPSGSVIYNGGTFTVPNGGVFLCDSNVYGCANPACSGDENGDDEEECPLPDHETDPCCGGFTLNPSSEATASGILRASITFNENGLRHAHVQNLKERHYGGEGGKKGAMRKLMPPNHLYIQSEEERQRVDAEWGAWGIKTGSGSQGVIGADPFLFQLNYAADFLGSALMPPDQGGSPTSFKTNSERLCVTTPINIDLTNVLARLPNQEKFSGTVIAADDDALCHEPLPGPKHGACVAQSSVGIDLGEAVGGVFGSIDIFPSFSFLRNIFTRTLGSGTEGDPGGFFRIFDLPGEEHENLDGEVEESSFTLKFSIGGFEIPFFQKRISFKNEEGEGGIWNTGTEAKADEGIKQKLTPPQAENNTTTYRAPNEPTIYLASNPVVRSATTYPQTTSFAEKVGRTLGGWLAKLITL